MIYKKLELEIDYSALGLPEQTERPELECFVPGGEADCEMQDTPRRRPAMLILPGGGYAFTSERENAPVAYRFLAADFAVFTLRYSVKPAVFPKALFEVYTAISLIRKNAEKWSVDPDKIAVCGFSAGGHLAASCGAFWNCDFVTKLFGDGSLHKPNAMVLSYPVISAGEYAHRGSFINLLGKDSLTPDETEYFSVENRVTADFPPSFVWHTSEDGAVPVANSLLLCESLSRNKVLFELHVYPRGGHGLSTCDRSVFRTDSPEPPEKPRAWISECISFLRDDIFKD